MILSIEGPISRLTPKDRAALLDRRPPDEPALVERVRAILAEVRQKGDSALFRMAKELDGVELEALEVPRPRWEEAFESLDPALQGALETAARHLRIFHEAQIPADLEVTTRPGVVLGRRAVPLRSAGVYAPGGRAAYPSSVLMGVVPAHAAGVREIVVCSPPGPGGLPPKEVLAAALIGGASRLFAVGGAGAIAALAYGTPTVPSVDVIVGPGNRYVTEAKRQVAGEVPIDSPAGPSDVLVLAQGTADPMLCALELLCQAEHDPDASVALVSDSESLISEVRAALEREVLEAPRRSIIETALARNGALLIASDWEEALAFARDYAPEHLALFSTDPMRDLEAVPTAGSAFLGESASVAFGDYLTGANHVLPTGGRARSFSSLSTLHFMRSYTWQSVSEGAAAELGPVVALLAEAEGLPGHRRAALARTAAGEPAPRPEAGEKSAQSTSAPSTEEYEGDGFTSDLKRRT